VSFEIDGKVFDLYGVVEPYLAEFEKFNTNCGYGYNKDALELQAFSHYTYIKSNENLIVVDLQGMKSDAYWILSDPAIQSVDSSFGITDRGVTGINDYLSLHNVHKCNKYCSIFLKEMEELKRECYKSGINIAVEELKVDVSKEIECKRRMTKE